MGDIRDMFRGTGRTTLMLKHALNIIYDENHPVIVVFNNITHTNHWKKQDWLRHVISSDLLRLRVVGPDIDWSMFSVRGVDPSVPVLFDHDVLEHQFASVFDKWSRYIDCNAGF